MPILKHLIPAILALLGAIVSSPQGDGIMAAAPSARSVTGGAALTADLHASAPREAALEPIEEDEQEEEDDQADSRAPSMRTGVARTWLSPREAAPPVLDRRRGDCSRVRGPPRSVGAA